MKANKNQKATYNRIRFHNDSNAFFQHLQELDSTAIIHLQQKTYNHLKAKSLFTQATYEDVEELTNDAILIVLQKIRNGDYQYQGFNPLTYAFIVADNLFRNFCRKKRIYCYPLENAELSKSPEIETYFAKKEMKLRIRTAMSELSPIAQKVIRLKYFDGLTDAEVIKKKLTIYSTVDSLKNRRCQYLKKLAKYMRLQDAA